MRIVSNLASGEAAIDFVESLTVISLPESYISLETLTLSGTIALSDSTGPLISQ